MAKIANFDPRPMVLLAAVCTANSFIIPTHQVNAFIQSPGCYRNADFFKAGIWITLIFLVITVSYFYLFIF
jgi:di/tricarboxylate transporter